MRTYAAFDVFSPYIDGREDANKRNQDDLNFNEDITKKRMDNRSTYLGLQQQEASQPGEVAVRSLKSNSILNNQDSLSQMFDNKLQTNVLEASQMRDARANLGQGYENYKLDPYAQLRLLSGDTSLLNGTGTGTGTGIGTVTGATSVIDTPSIANNTNAQSMIPTTGGSVTTSDKAFQDDPIVTGQNVANNSVVTTQEQNGPSVADTWAQFFKDAEKNQLPTPDVPVYQVPKGVEDAGNAIYNALNYKVHLPASDSWRQQFNTQQGSTGVLAPTTEQNIPGVSNLVGDALFGGTTNKTAVNSAGGTIQQALGGQQQQQQSVKPQQQQQQPQAMPISTNTNQVANALNTASVRVTPANSRVYNPNGLGVTKTGELTLYGKLPQKLGTDHIDPTEVIFKQGSTSDVFLPGVMNSLLSGIVGQGGKQPVPEVSSVPTHQLFEFLKQSKGFYNTYGIEGSNDFLTTYTVMGPVDKDTGETMRSVFLLSGMMNGKPVKTDPNGNGEHFVPVFNVRGYINTDNNQRNV